MGHETTNGHDKCTVFGYSWTEILDRLITEVGASSMLRGACLSQTLVIIMLLSCYLGFFSTVYLTPPTWQHIF